MGNRYLQTIIVIAMSAVMPLSYARAQDIISTLKRLHLPTDQLVQFRFPFAQTQPGAKPTGTGYRLIASYYMAYDTTTGFFRADDSTRLYWHVGKGTKDAWQLVSEFSAVHQQVPDPIADNIGYDVDSSVKYTTNASGFYTDPVYKYEHIRDGNGLTTYITEKHYDTGITSWTDESRYVYSYDAGGHMLSRDEEVWSQASNSWGPVLTERKVYGYTGAGQLEFANKQIFGGSWMDYNGNFYGYDGDTWVMQLRRTANLGTSTWTVNDSITNTFDAADRLFTQTMWFSKYRDSLVYNASGQCEQEIRLQLNLVDNSWENYWRWVHVYDASGKQISATQQFWVDGDWENNYQYQYLYSGNNVVNSIFQVWNATTASFDNQYQLKAEYDSRDLLTSFWRESWNPAGSWESHPGDDKYMFFYEEYDNTVSVHDPEREVSFMAYPNPAGIYLILETKGRSIDQVQITDVSGKEVYVHKGKCASGTLRIPTAQLPAGIYAVHVESGGASGNRMISIRH